MDYIISKTGTMHIGLFNYNNSFCHHISVLQRLHSSSILNNLLRKDIKSTLTEVQYELLKPLIIYSKITKKNHGETYIELKEYFEEFVPKYVNENSLHGYNVGFILIYYYCPLIYLAFPTRYFDILSELHIDPINFNSSTYVIEDIYKSYPYLKIGYSDGFMELYLNMISNMREYDLRYFVSSVLEIFPNKDKTGGHGVSLILSEDDEFYIIDDQNAISTLSLYYKRRKERIYEMSVRDIDGASIANINKVLNSICSIHPEALFQNRVSRYVLNFEILTDNDNIVQYDKNIIKCIFVFIVGFVIGLIISFLINILQTDSVLRFKSIE